MVRMSDLLVLARLMSAMVDGVELTVQKLELAQLLAIILYAYCIPY